MANSVGAELPTKIVATQQSMLRRQTSQRVRGIFIALLAVLVFGAAAGTAHAQVLQVLTSFGTPNGESEDPIALIVGNDGNFYGATRNGGLTAECTANTIFGCGMVFKITPAGQFTSLYEFCSQPGCPDGSLPESLIQGTDGNFYGTTDDGGTSANCTQTSGCGTVFQITPAGQLTTLYNFCSQTGCTDGYGPGTLIQGANGNLFSTTFYGGPPNNNCGGVSPGCGTVFELTTAGTFTTLYSFCGCGDGGYPGDLIQATDGNLYGVALADEIFGLTPTGQFTNLCPTPSGCPAIPKVSLIQGKDGNLYDTGNTVGTNGLSSFFKTTLDGVSTLLYSCKFQYINCPGAPIMQALNGDFYGPSVGGGGTECANSEGCGTIMQYTTAGKVTTVYSFGTETGDPDGADPSLLVQTSNGTFYGFSSGGKGTNFFSLGPLVQLNLGSGKVGSGLLISGTSVSSATAVTFNGTPATFSVVKNEVKTYVPAGATSGYISVTTPTQTLWGNQFFKVVPQFQTFSPSDGPVGTPVTITGVSLTQTTKVTFGGIAASSFTVNSDTQVTATVPTKAKTGKIVVTTAGGTASSATSFTVTP